MKTPTRYPERARRGQPRRAFSLLELVAVTAILGILAAAAALRFGNDALNTTDTEGFVRELVLDLRLARRATIATGDDHFVRFNRESGDVVSYDVMRAASGGDTPIQPTNLKPDKTTITSGFDTLRFDFSGAKIGTPGPNSLQIDGARFTWTVTVHQATGIVLSERAPQP